MKKTYTLALVAALLSCAVGCQRKPADAGRLEVQPRSLTLAYPRLVNLHLAWTPAATAGGEDSPSEPLVFLHLLGPKGQVLRTFDHPFPQHWVAGTPVNYDVKLYQSALVPPLDPGKYRLTVGLYDQGGRRWALEGLGEPIARQEYSAAEVLVPSPSGGPRLEFSPAWLPLTAGSDKQVVARRWLADQPGEIQVQSIPGPGTLWLSFRIPLGEGPSDKLVYHDPAANTPAVVVRGTCGAVETGISGPGPHDVEMPIESAGPAGVCKISLVPNFHVLSPGPLPVRSVSLENAAFSDGSTRGASPGAGPDPAGSAPGQAAPPRTP